MKKLISLLLLCGILLCLVGCEKDIPSPVASDDAAASETPQEDLPGILSSFTATDLEGNEIDESILSSYTLTMVNVWATFCGPCLQEMPDLGALAKEYESQGVQIIGMVSDVLNSDGTISETQIETALDIAASTGADYLHIVPSYDLYGLLYQISSVPTTFFVDAEGNQVGNAYLGAKTRSEWISIIDSVLAEVQE